MLQKYFITHISMILVKIGPCARHVLLSHHEGRHTSSCCLSASASVIAVSSSPSTPLPPALPPPCPDLLHSIGHRYEIVDYHAVSPLLAARHTFVAHKFPPTCCVACFAQAAWEEWPNPRRQCGVPDRRGLRPPQQTPGSRANSPPLPPPMSKASACRSSSFRVWGQAKAVNTTCNVVIASCLAYARPCVSTTSKREDP